MISLRAGAGHQRQRDRLLDEGVLFDAQGKVDLERFGWGSPAAGLEQNENSSP
jgi:alkylated DNA nucleotide flippase Atl1